jgi:hypothetical protein
MIEEFSHAAAQRRNASRKDCVLRTVCETVVFETKFVKILTHIISRGSLVDGRAWGGTCTGVLSGLLQRSTSVTTGLEQYHRSNLSDLGAIEVDNTKTCRSTM